MVWSTTQSALYNDLSRYYEDDEKPRENRENSDSFKTGSNEKYGDKLSEKCCNESAEKCCDELSGKCCDELSGRCCDNSPKNCSNECPQNFGNKCGKDPERDRENKNHPVCPNCPRIRQAPNDQISRLISDKFSDRDMLLIAGLIFLLMKQGADRKLILALAFVLLS